MGSGHFLLSDIKPALPIQGWEKFLLHGDGYLKTATMAFAKGKESFTPEILYNIISMAIEKFVMSALMRFGKMPYNHTMKDLVESLETNFPEILDSEMKEGLLNLDTYQDICDIESYRIKTPGMEEIPKMLNLAYSLQQLFTQENIICRNPDEIP